MNTVLQKYLAKKYHIFFDYLKEDKSDIMLPIYFGFECDDGWFNLLDTLMGQIKHYCEWKKIEPIRITQIKEKFGTLCFYYENGDTYINGMVSMTTQMSSKTCEVCGTMNNVGRTSGGWVKYMCQDCHSKSQRLSDLKWTPNSTERILKIAKLFNGKRNNT